MNTPFNLNNGHVDFNNSNTMESHAITSVDSVNVIKAYTKF